MPGIEINDQIARTAKMNMIIHDDGHTNVVSHDGLYRIDYIAEKTNNQGFKENSFDFIVTNPPFGSIIKQSEQAYMKSDGNSAPYYDFSLKNVNWIDTKIKGNHTATGRESQSTEVLFIEQCHKFLKAGGILAIVIPDGILTNSSSQYVRDDIEDNFRIIAVVSLPQTAFTNTGAGVKSSVLFLKKHDTAMTKKIREEKWRLQDELALNNQIAKTADAWDKEKTLCVKKGDAYCQQIEVDLKNALHELTPELKKQAEKEAKELRKEYEKTEVYAEWKKAINEEYSDKLNAFKEELDERYQAEKQVRLPDYPIFMAIAENIGYDAKGNNSDKLISKKEFDNDKGEKIIIEIYQNDLFNTEKTKHRQLDKGKEVDVLIKETMLPNTGLIGELTRFIEAVEARQDSFFI
jgi:type I restriction enzyme M protein